MNITLSPEQVSRIQKVKDLAKSQLDQNAYGKTLFWEQVRRAINPVLRQVKKNDINMSVYRIRLKRHPARFVGRRNSSYAVTPWKDVTPGASWFVAEARAKIWTSLGEVKSFLGHCGVKKGDVLSEYELVEYPIGTPCIVRPLGL
jgi:hypothetical protein